LPSILYSQATTPAAHNSHPRRESRSVGWALAMCDYVWTSGSADDSPIKYGTPHSLPPRHALSLTAIAETRLETCTSFSSLVTADEWTPSHEQTTASFVAGHDMKDANEAIAQSPGTSSQSASLQAAKRLRYTPIAWYVLVNTVSRPAVVLTRSHLTTLSVTNARDARSSAMDKARVIAVRDNQPLASTLSEVAIQHLGRKCT
jgi:hypothetical protein